MRRPPRSALLLGASLLLLGGCSRSMVHGLPAADGSIEDGGDDDVGGPDGGLDAGVDAGLPDAGLDGGRPDGGRPDGGPDGGRPDGGGPGDCGGPSRLGLGRTLVRPLPVTSTPLAMGCCDGAFLHLHAEDALGRVLTLMVRGWGGMSEGSFDLDASHDAYEVSITLDNGQLHAPVSGQLTVERDPPGDWSAPAFISLCGTFELWGEPARLWIDRAVVAPWDWQDRFSLRLLADPDQSALEAANRPLDDLALAPGSLISTGTIDWYDRSEHAIHPQGFQDPAQLARQLPAVGVGGLPFVVIADGRRLYLGAFWTDLSSLVFRGPTIRMERLDGEAFFLEPPMGTGGLDPRDDPRLFDVLRQSGKLAP